MYSINNYLYSYHIFLTKIKIMKKFSLILLLIVSFQITQANTQSLLDEAIELLIEEKCETSLTDVEKESLVAFRRLVLLVKHKNQKHNNPYFTAEDILLIINDSSLSASNKTIRVVERGKPTKSTSYMYFKDEGEPAGNLTDKITY